MAEGEAMERAAYLLPSAVGVSAAAAPRWRLAQARGSASRADSAGLLSQARYQAAESELEERDES